MKCLPVFAASIFKRRHHLKGLLFLSLTPNLSHMKQLALAIQPLGGCRATVRKCVSDLSHCVLLLNPVLWLASEAGQMQLGGGGQSPPPKQPGGVSYWHKHFFFLTLPPCPLIWGVRQGILNHWTLAELSPVGSEFICVTRKFEVFGVFLSHRNTCKTLCSKHLLKSGLRVPRFGIIVSFSPLPSCLGIATKTPHQTEIPVSPEIDGISPHGCPLPIRTTDHHNGSHSCLLRLSTFVPRSPLRSCHDLASVSIRDVSQAFNITAILVSHMPWYLLLKCFFLSL